MRLTDGGDEDVRVEGVVREVARAGVARRHGRVRGEQQLRHRLPDDAGASDDDGVGAAQLDLVLLEHAHDAERRAGDECGPAEIEPGGVDGMDPVDVLRRVDRLDHGCLVDVAGERQLDEQAVHAVVGVELRDEREHVLLARVGRNAVVARLDAGRLRRLLLQVDVDVRRRVVADEDGRDADVVELRDGCGDLLAYLGGSRGERSPCYRSGS